MSSKAYRKSVLRGHEEAAPGKEVTVILRGFCPPILVNSQSSITTLVPVSIPVVE